jgi:hypothetical protein
MGSDAVNLAGNKIQVLQSELAEHQALSQSTDF